MVVAANQVEQIVGTEVPFLTKEDVDDLLALAGALAALRLQPGQIGKRVCHTDPRA
jgi:hypothetical protein